MARLLDKLTAAKIRDGDLPSFEALMAAYKDKMFHYCLGLCNNYHQAEEITQEVFIKVYQNIARYDWRIASLSTWIYTIAHNLLMNSLRTKTRETLYEDIDAGEPPDTAEEAFLRKELVAELNQALQSLPPEERSLLIMKDYYGFKLKEISGITGLPVGTLKSRLHNIRIKIRMAMGEWDD